MCGGILSEQATDRGVFCMFSAQRCEVIYCSVIYRSCMEVEKLAVMSVG